MVFLCAFCGPRIVVGEGASPYHSGLGFFNNDNSGPQNAHEEDPRFWCKSHKQLVSHWSWPGYREDVVMGVSGCASRRIRAVPKI